MGQERDDTTSVEVVFVGFPALYRLFKGERVRHIFSGGVLVDLVDDLARCYGRQVSEFLFKKGSRELDPTIRVRINDALLKMGDVDTEPVKDGDEVTFLRLLAGG
jgi:hypothetical protein